MGIKEKVYEIINKYDNGDLDECIEEIKSYLGNDIYVKSFKTFMDIDVFDSFGLDIYYIAVSWTDINGNLDMCCVNIKHYEKRSK